MLKSDLEIEPYTIYEALTSINKELKLLKRKPLVMGTFYNLISSLEVKRFKLNNKKESFIEYNSIVDVYNHIKQKRYPKERKSRKT